MPTLHRDMLPLVSPMFYSIFSTEFISVGRSLSHATTGSTGHGILATALQARCMTSVSKFRNSNHLTPATHMAASGFHSNVPNGYHSNKLKKVKPALAAMSINFLRRTAHVAVTTVQSMYGTVTGSRGQNQFWTSD